MNCTNSPLPLACHQGMPSLVNRPRNGSPQRYPEMSRMSPTD
jgi:hypothetical protein